MEVRVQAADGERRQWLAPARALLRGLGLDRGSGYQCARCQCLVDVSRHSRHEG